MRVLAVPCLVIVVVTAPTFGRPTLAQEALAVSIDASQVGTPISKYVYGQFIEHLGRCIYGGLWAEMLEDRKFYYPVTGEAPAWELFEPGPSSWEGEGHPYELLVRSPWMVIGGADSVSMAAEGAYVGQHSPEITSSPDPPSTGLMQERLALEVGREYVGRIVVAGQATAAPVRVSLAWGSGASDRETVVIDQLGPDHVKVPLRFTAGGSTDNGRLEIVGRGSGRFRVGAVSLMPADHVGGWRADTLALLKELDAPIYRWPGGNFVSGYDWRDGIGDPDRRPPRKNPTWKGVEHNDVGIHEYMFLLGEIGAEAFIAVNTGLGGAEGAARQVEYVNGSTDTTMGRLRAAHGHPLPFGVEWWAVGNEMYGDWQLGFMPLDEYVQKHNRVVDAMRAADPTIRPVAVGNVGDWSRQMLASCAERMDLISEHLYWQDEEDLLAHVRQVPAGIGRVARAHRAYREVLPSLREREIQIALDEWNLWYGPYEYGELGTRYFLQDALGIAAGLHELFRHSDLFFMANYAQTVNVIGAIKTTPTDAELEPTGLVLALYRRRFGDQPVSVSHSRAPLDVAAAWTPDRASITLGIVNPTEQPWRLTPGWQGARPTGQGRRWVLHGPDRWAANRPGQPRSVDIVQRSFSSLEDGLEVPRLSVTLYELAVE